MPFLEDGGMLDLFTLGNGDELVEMLIEALGLDDSSVGGKFDKSYISGYEYYAGLHIGVCHGPVDRVTEIQFRGKTGWKGVAAPGVQTTYESGYSRSNPVDQESPRSGPDNYGPNVIVVNKDSLFGGEEVEGGVLGLVDVLHGGRTQQVHSYLNTKLRPKTAAPGERQVYTPAYRGILSLVFHSNIKSYKEYVPKEWLDFSIIGKIIAKNRTAKLSEPATSHTGFYWGAMNPSLKEVAVRAFRALEGWNVPGGCWYPAKAIVIRDGREFMNPVHIAVQCLCDLRFGMKLSPLQIGQSFKDCADQLHHTSYVDQYGVTRPGEAVGLGIVWWGENTIREFLAEIMRYINGNVYIDPATGLFEMSLVRPVPEDQIANLPLLTESQIIDFGTFSRPIGEETVNTITVVYTQYDNEKTESITRSNTAMTSIYGVSIPDTVHLPGVKSSKLAAEICERIVRQRCSLAGRYQRMRVSRLAPTEGTTSQAAFTMIEGSPFRLRYLEHGIDGQVFRVANINYKTLEDNYIEFDAVEDSFALVDSPYVVGGPESGWINLNEFPKNFEAGDLKLIYTPYVSVLAMGGSPLIKSLPTTTILFTVLASRDDQGVTQGIEVWSSTSPSATRLTKGPMCPTSSLDGALPILDNASVNGSGLRTSVKMKDMVGVSEYSAVGAWFYVDNEAIRCVSVVDDPDDPDYLLMELERGIFDTVPEDHADGAKMWWYNGLSGASYTGTAYQDEVFDPARSFPVVPYGRAGSPPIDGNSATVGWPYLGAPPPIWPAPYPPAALSQGGVLLNRNTLLKPIIEWACRNRVAQSDVAVPWDLPGIPHEEGTTYIVEVKRVFYSPPIPQSPMNIATISGITAEGPSGFLYFNIALNYDIPGYTNISQQYFNTQFTIQAVRQGFYSKSFTYEAEWIVGYNYGYGYGYGGMTNGISLTTPETSLSPIDYSNTRCARPIWFRERWAHCDAFLYGIDSDGGLVAAPADYMPIYYARGDMTDFSVANNYSLHPNYYQSIPCASFSSGYVHRIVIMSSTRTGIYWCPSETGAPSVTMLYTNTDCYTPSSVKFDFVTITGTEILASANKGSDVFTCDYSLTVPSSYTLVRQGTVNLANPVTDLIQVEFIKKFGANYVAVGRLNTDHQRIAAASSTDLVNWTLQNSDMPSRAVDPWAWQYYPTTSEWLIFQTVGDPEAGGGTRVFRTTDGFTFTSDQIRVSSYAPCLGNALIYYRVATSSYRIDLFAGGMRVTSDDGVNWSNPVRADLSPLQVAEMASKMYEPFTTTYPGAGPYAEDSPTTQIPLEARKALVRTGVNIYNDRFVESHPGHYYAGAVIDLYNGQIASPDPFKYPVAMGGCLPDYASGSMYDCGFSTGGTSLVDIHALKGRSSGPAFFEVYIGGSGACIIGLAAAGAPAELSGTTSVVLDNTGVLMTDLVLTCPGELIGGSAKTPAEFSGGLEGRLVGFTFVAGQVKIYLDGSYDPYKIVTGLETGLVYFPVFSSLSTPISINLGQKPFQPQMEVIRVADGAAAWLS